MSWDVKIEHLHFSYINPLSAKSTKWSNTLKQFVGCCRQIILSVLNYFVGLALKWLSFLSHEHSTLTNWGQFSKHFWWENCVADMSNTLISVPRKVFMHFIQGIRSEAKVTIKKLKGGYWPSFERSLKLLSIKYPTTRES